MTPTENWPKPWLLQIHEQAVKDGFVWIKPISQEDADSLKSRLYRIRRRSDASMAAFIPPEFHLVMVGAWENVDGGRLPIIYDKRADGLALPSIVTPDGSEAERYTPKPQLAEPVVIDVESLDTTINDEEIGSYVDQLRKKAEQRAKKEQ